MKGFAPYCILLAALFAAAPLAAKDSGPPQFNTIVVKHFTNANGMTQSPEFINYFADTLSSQLLKLKVAQQVLREGVTVADAAANSLVIEGKFTGRDKEIYMVTVGKLSVEIDIYRMSDHALVKTITVKALIPPSPSKNDEDMAAETASQIAHQIQQALKGIDLSSIPLVPPPAVTMTPVAAAPAPSSGAAPAGPDAVASVQLSSDPSGAEITIDGNYAGDTPSLIKMKPGTHSIRITKNGYTPWERSIETGAGESRTVAAALEEAGP